MRPTARLPQRLQRTQRTESNSLYRNVLCALCDLLCERPSSQQIGQDRLQAMIASILLFDRHPFGVRSSYRNAGTDQTLRRVFTPGRKRSRPFEISAGSARLDCLPVSVFPPSPGPFRSVPSPFGSRCSRLCSRRCCCRCCCTNWSVGPSGRRGSLPLLFSEGQVQCPSWTCPLSESRCPCSFTTVCHPT